MPKFFLLTLILILQSGITLFSQSLNPETFEYRYWIYFKDKGKYKPGDRIEKGSEAYKIAVSELSDKALWRRAKVLDEDKIVSYLDLPVNEEYIDGIKKIGASPHAVSKWFNAVSVKVLKAKLDEIKKLPFVEKVEGVHYLEVVKYITGTRNNFTYTVSDSIKYNYGISYWQNQQINVPVLHNYGITGYGVTVGMCDNGFNWRNHQALRTRKVLGEYDWIYKDDSTQFQESPNQIPSDAYSQDDHGTATMSTLGGYYPGQLIGPAFDAEFYLSKTEADVTETPVEEDYWLEAVEWMEAKGVEVVSSSLIYKPFDAPNNNYTYKDMDGRTTVIVRAANYAKYLGIVVLNSMGNESQTDPPSIVSPPDGESVIAVGAVDSSGTIAFFSSNGPTSDNRIKPDIVAMGVDDYTAVSPSGTVDDSGYTFSSGTSFSCPLVAGVCALILSAHPELTPDQVKESLRMTADKKDNPDNIYGWGLVNAYEAALYYGMIISNKPEVTKSGSNTILSIYVVSKNQIDISSVKLYYSTEDGEFQSIIMDNTELINDTNSGKYSVVLPFELNKPSLKIYFSASDSVSNRTVPFNAPDKFFYYNRDTELLEIF